MKPGLIIILFLALTSVSFAQKGRDETLAASYFQNGEYDKAAELYQSLWEKNNYAPQFYTPLFSTYITLKKFDDAEKVVKKQTKKTSERLLVPRCCQHAHGQHGACCRLKTGTANLMSRCPSTSWVKEQGLDRILEGA